MIRLVYLLRRREGMSLAEFQRYWWSVHGPLVASFATSLDIRRYVQVHTLESPFNAALSAPRGTEEPAYDGVAELWWDSEPALIAAMGSDAGRAAAAALLADEAKFIDFAASPLWFNVEYPQVNPVGEAVVALPRSTWVKLYYPLRLREDLGVEAGQRYWRVQHGPIIRGLAPALGIHRYQQVHRIDSTLEAGLREARGTTVAPYDGHAETWFDLGTPRQAEETRRAGELAVEDERRFIDLPRSPIWIGKERVLIDRFGWD